MWSFCLCSGHYILVNFSETIHVTVISYGTYGNMIIFCNCLLNLNNFLIVCHKATFQENVMGFQIHNITCCYDIISYMSTVEDIRTKSMLCILGEFNRKINYISILL